MGKRLKAIVLSRITQLLVQVSAAACAYLAAKYGITLESLSAGEASVIASASLLLYSAWVHKRKYGVWLWHPDEKQ